MPKATPKAAKPAAAPVRTIRTTRTIPARSPRPLFFHAKFESPPLFIPHHTAPYRTMLTTDEFAAEMATFDTAHESRRIAALIIRGATPLCDAAIEIVIEYRWLEPRDIRLWPRCDIGAAPRYLIYAIANDLPDHVTAIFSTYDRASHWPAAAAMICGTDEKKLDTLFAAMETCAHRGRLAPDEYAAVILSAYIAYDKSTLGVDRRMCDFLLSTGVSTRIYAALSDGHYDEEILRSMMEFGGGGAPLEKIIDYILSHMGGGGIDADDISRLFDA